MAKKTDIACWWCCHQFEHIALGISEYIDKSKVGRIQIAFDHKK